MSSDTPQITVDGPGVTIEVINERTAWLASEYVDDVVNEFDTDLEGLALIPERCEPTVNSDLTGLHTDVVAERGTTDTDDSEPSEPSEPSDPTDDADRDSADSADEDTDDEPADATTTADGPVDDTTPVGENLTDLQQEVVDALAEHGEQTAADLKTVTAQDDGVYNRLNTLEEKGLVETRANPDDGRQTLYSLAPEADEPDSDTTANVEGEDDDQGEQDEPETLGGPETSNSPTITVEDTSQTRTLDANDVVDAIAEAPSTHRPKTELGLSTTGFKRLLEQLDLTAFFEKEAPLATDYVRETVATYLGGED